MITFLLLSLACQPAPATFDPVSVFPSNELMADGRVAIPDDLLAHADTPVPVERLSWRHGFSRVQTTVFDLEQPIAADSLPGLDALDAAGSVQIWDLDSGERLPCFAELDAYPQDKELPTLLVRPAQPMPVGHQVAVVLTDQVLLDDGQPLASPYWWVAALEGRQVDGLHAEHSRELSERLSDLGVEGVVLAVDFPIGEGALPLRAALRERYVPTSWSFERVLDAETATTLTPGTWIWAEGEYTVRNWLVEDRFFDMDDEGTPAPQGEVQADLTVFIPESVRDAEPGTVPVWIFGHGIFSKPSDYLKDGDDGSNVVALADAAGAILISTTWRGLTRSDIGTAIGIGNDFGTIPELTDKLAQGVSNNLALSRLILEGELLDDPLFMGLADDSQLFYYGISLGGIEGAILIANQPDIEYGVLHVGGSAWSSMLERSSNWAQFEVMVADGVPSAGDRQRLYAASQLFWDVADPASFGDELRDRRLLWQEAIGDEQVPNFTTELLARQVGMTLLEPDVTAPWGISPGDTSAGPVLSQFDPELPLPEDANRPGAVTGAHGAPRMWDGTLEQTRRFLDADDPGVVEHYCGELPCAESNPG